MLALLTWLGNGSQVPGPMDHLLVIQKMGDREIVIVQVQGGYHTISNKNEKKGNKKANREPK